MGGRSDLRGWAAEAALHSLWDIGGQDAAEDVEVQDVGFVPTGRSTRFQSPLDLWGQEGAAGQPPQSCGAGSH